jgi:hypothetical protein
MVDVQPRASSANSDSWSLPFARTFVADHVHGISGVLMLRHHFA